MQVNLNAVLSDAQGKAIILKPGLAQLAQTLLDMGMKPALVDNTVAGLAPLLDEPKEEAVELTARRACVEALGSYDKDATGSKIIDRVGLALKIESGNGELEITEDQAKDTLARIKEVYRNPFVYYRVDMLFKQAAVDAKKPLP